MAQRPRACVRIELARDIGHRYPGSGGEGLGHGRRGCLCRLVDRLHFDAVANGQDEALAEPRPGQAGEKAGRGRVVDEYAIAQFD